MQKAFFWRFQYALLMGLWVEKQLSAEEFQAVALLLCKKMQEKVNEEE